MAGPYELRSKLYLDAHGEPTEVFDADDSDVCVEAFEFDFSPEPDEEDIGYVLFTNGMSDRRMHLDAEAEAALESGEIKARAELVWHVPELDDRYVQILLWLAEFPFIDETWLGFGHTIPMPEPIIEGTDLTAFLFLTPIMGRHKELADRLVVDGEPVELLVVHLLTTAEYEFKKERGTPALLELFDETGYGPILDPERASLV
jgi:hypothetical protein